MTSLWKKQYEESLTSHERGRSYGTGTSDETPRWMRPSQLKTSVADVSSHMDDILSPDSEVSEVFFPDDEQGLSTFSKSNSDVSADSIIRRVEEEIAAARRAAADAKSRLGPDVQQTMAVNTVMENQSKDEDDDMQAILNKESVLSKHPLPDRDVAEEFEEEFNGVHKDDQISLFSQTDDRSSFDFFADEFKHCSEEVDEIKMEEQTQCNSSGVPSKAKKHFEDKDLSTRISSPATTVETIPASNNIGPTNSWEHLETHGAGRNPRKLSNVSLRALGGVETNDADEEEASVHGNSSIGTSIGGSRNAQRARAILDTLKERRETFKSAFLTSNTISRSSTPLPPDKEGSTPPQDILSDEKKEDESNTAPWNRPVIEDLPPPTKKKVKKKKTEPKPNLEAKAEAKVKEVEETLNRKSRRIRFRDTFPVLKPTNRPRVAEDIIADHTLGQPNFPIRWVRPKSNLRQLIVAAMGNSLQRRSNACGALKVLTRQKKNQLTLARTDSFLEALLFAASQDIPTHGDKELALNARTRAIACLRNVCQPKDNRVHILVHAGNMECLLRVIKEDHGEPRVLACMALALLAKTPECRETMANTEGLVDLLSLVLRGVSDTREVKSHDSIEYLRGDSDKDFSSRSESESSERSSIRQGDSHTEASDENSISSDNSTLSETSSHCENLDVGESKRKQNQRYMKRSNLSQRKRHALINADLEPKARSNACAVLVHLSKHCAVSSLLCSNATLVDSLIVVSREKENPVHSKSLEIILNLTRFPPNTSFLTRYEGLLDTLVAAAESTIDIDRVTALRSLQNLSGDSSSKAILATDGILSSITACALRNTLEEREAAVAFLYNVSTEPGAVVAITNTKNVVATLVHLAHHPGSTSDVRLIACDALSTISLWLQTLAGTGRVPKDLPNIPLPSHKTTGWSRWE